MKSAVLDEAIYNRYIVPTKRERTPLVGLEFELPIINRKKEPVNFDVVHKVTDAFIQKFSFDKLSKPVQNVLDFEHEKFTEAENRYAWQIRARFQNGYVKKTLELVKERLES